MERNVEATGKAEQLRIELFINQSTVPGDVCSYEMLEKKTGVKMDNTGKARLRRVLDKLGVEFSVIRGYGLMLASPELVMPILAGKVIKIDAAVRRADKTHANLHKAFFNQLSPEAQRQVLFAGAIFGAIRVAAENGRQIYSEHKKSGKGSDRIPLPG